MKHKAEHSRKMIEDRSYALSPEQLLEASMKEGKKTKEDWTKKDLPRLTEKMLNSYERDAEFSHLNGKDLPSKSVTIGVLNDVLTVLFPGYHGKGAPTTARTKLFLDNKLNSIHNRLLGEVEKSLKYVCGLIQKCSADVCRARSLVVVKEVLDKIPGIREVLKGDIRAAYDGDPAAKSIDEVILSYPCVVAIAIYRISHELYVRGVPLIPRIMNEYAHSITGIDIHPGARIGKNFFIDHGTGVVIGETAEIGDNVRIYQGVTLGAMSFLKDEHGRLVKGLKRHPTVKNNVVIYSGATILGEKAVIGEGATIGGNVWITSSIPPWTTVTIVPPRLIYKNKEKTVKHRRGS